MKRIVGLTRSKVVRAASGASLALMLLATPVLASSYTSTFDFSATTLNGQTRYYSGTYVAIQFDTYIVNGSGSGSIRTELWRNGGCWWGCNTYIGYVTGPYVGFSQGYWYNVGSGNYYFVFKKLADGIEIASDDVQMWSN